MDGWFVAEDLNQERAEELRENQAVGVDVKTVVNSEGMMIDWMWGKMAVVGIGVV